MKNSYHQFHKQRRRQDPLQNIQKAVIFTFLIIGSIINAQTDKNFIGSLLLNQSAPEVNNPVEKSILTKMNRNPYRSIDGTANNISNHNRRNWGAANIILHRKLSAFYGVENPAAALNDTDRPSPRAISNLICDETQDQTSNRYLSALGFQWGQFLDHDMTLSPTGSEPAPIPLPENETVFNVPIPFSRSAFTMVRSQREQMNLITAYIDGSGVYGSSEERAHWLRTFSKGELKTSSGNLLPYNTLNGEITGTIDPQAPEMDGDDHGTRKTFVGGDVRLAENPVLTAIHTIFVREHNRICKQLFRVGYRNDEVIYQIARKRVGAIIQSITFNEYLPSLGVRLRPFRGYKSNTRPDILNTFSAASFRIGHTLVTQNTLLLDDNCDAVGPGEFGLVDTFFNPNLFKEYPIKAWLKGEEIICKRW